MVGMVIVSIELVLLLLIYRVSYVVTQLYSYIVTLLCIINHSTLPTHRTQHTQHSQHTKHTKHSQHTKHTKHSQHTKHTPLTLQSYQRSLLTSCSNPVGVGQIWSLLCRYTGQPTPEHPQSKYRDRYRCSVGIQCQRITYTRICTSYIFIYTYTHIYTHIISQHTMNSTCLVTLCVYTSLCI